MTFFYRGAGIGTFWHATDARLAGFQAQSPGMDATVDRLIQHIARATTSSPYISLTRSYGVALDYALVGRAIASASNPAYVYEIELDDTPTTGITLLDPLREIVARFPHPASTMSYQHDGAQEFLLGVIDPKNHQLQLTGLCPRPPGDASTPRPPNLSPELEAILRALRDAEIVAVGNIPVSRIKRRFDVF